jgi:hypothetical protein
VPPSGLPDALDASRHWRLSRYRESIIEHLFVAEVLRHFWGKGATVEVLKPQVDDNGYDLALECNKILRYIQLKSSQIPPPKKPRNKPRNVNCRLFSKVNGCVILVRFRDDTFDPRCFQYSWWGGAPGEGCPRTDFGLANQTRFNKLQGVRKKRTETVVIPGNQFKDIAFAELMESLFEKTASGRQGTDLAVSPRSG